MVFSRLWMTLFALGVVPLLFTGMFSGLLTAALAWYGLLVLLAVADWFLLPAPETLTVEREVDDKLSLGAANAVRVRVRNGSRMDVQVQLRDTPPETVPSDVEEAPFSFTVPAGGRHAAVYHLTPKARGDYRFGDVHLRIAGRLRMVQRLLRISLPQAVKVYPNYSTPQRLR